MTYLDIRNKVQSIIEGCRTFKIGITSMNPFTDRLKQSDYVIFKEIHHIANTNDEEVARECEKYLIDHFVSHHKCRNVASAAGTGSLGSSETIVIYVVTN